MLELPRLSSAELTTRFGSDEAALRRYRMLVALLREGRTPGEVARTFGVSRESLRRLRHDFERQGLEALRSRKRGGGHFARASPLAEAVKQFLDEEPGISSALLWRRVRAELVAYGETVPRSTFYRLLNQLRGEDTNPANERAPVRVLREALGAVAEDPPLALGRSELAALMLPDLRDLLQRGRQLQQAMRAAIERLRPSEAGPVLDDVRWRHYLIIAGEYETGEKRSTLQDALALSASTYSRAKREALERLLVLLPVTLAELPPPGPPASMIAPPPPPKDFDREGDLEQCMIRLRRGGLALIWGQGGTGKLDLAAMLASRLRGRGQKVVWHTCHAPDAEPNAGISLLVTLSAALALDGRQDLWDMLRTPETLNLPQCLALLSEALVGRHWILCIANAHWLNDNSGLQVLDVLTEARERRDLRMVLVSRNLPPWADAETWPPLGFYGDSYRPPPHSTTRTASLSIHADLDMLRERVQALLTGLPLDTLDALPHEQISQILEDLRPIEQLVREMRATLGGSAAREEV